MVAQTDAHAGRAGTFVLEGPPQERFRVFIPHSLPPDPPLQLSGEQQILYEKASQSVGRLDGVGQLLPHVHLFLYYYVRKEALVSSQIEGTQSSFSDLLLYESNITEGIPLTDVREVSNYLAALEYGISKLSKLPLSGRLFREIHGILLSQGRGSAKIPGEFRTSQNWINGSRPGNALFVPPPPAKVAPLMADLEKFLHNDPTATPTLIKAALAHVQFESIHPFLDGNGRLGRLLITLLLCAEGVLQKPLLYLSLYFKANREQYYGLLQAVRTQGAWEAWLTFFLTGVHETAQQAVATAHRILKMFDKDRKRIQHDLGRASGSALRVHHYLQAHPLLSVPSAATELKLTPPTVYTSVRNLIRLGIVNEITGRSRDQLYVYRQYFNLLKSGTEPIRL